MTNAIELANVTVAYPNFQLAIEELIVPTGSIIGLVGANGAGKTTTLKSILGLTPEATGQISVLGEKMDGTNKQLKTHLASVLDESFFDERLTGLEIANILQHSYPNWQRTYFTKQLEKNDISLKTPFKNLSKGRKMKVKIYSALASQPQLLLLDEPTSGLDPLSRQDLLKEFQLYLEQHEASILFSSHITTDIEKIADYVIFMAHGQLALTLDMDTFMNDYGLLQLTQSQVADLGCFPYLYCQKNAYNTQYLITNRTTFAREYPELSLRPATLEDVLIMLERGGK